MVDTCTHYSSYNNFVLFCIILFAVFNKLCLVFNFILNMCIIIDGRYKIKVTIGSKPGLLLVREETQLVSRQLSQWADILMLVFSYSSLNSLNQLTEIYQMFTSLRYDTVNPTILLVGVVGELDNT